QAHDAQGGRRRRSGGILIGGVRLFAQHPVQKGKVCDHDKNRPEDDQGQGHHKPVPESCQIAVVIQLVREGQEQVFQNTHPFVLIHRDSSPFLISSRALFSTASPSTRP